MKPSVMFDKVWDSHVVAQAGDDIALLHIDRLLLHDLSGTAALHALHERGLPIHSPDLAFATPDHAVSTMPGRTGTTFAGGARLWAGLKALSSQGGVRFFDLGEPGQGIVHVMAPELGLVQPGATLVCGDSHTCTNGGVGALAFGIGSSEVTHVLATQTLWQRKPKTLRIRFDGRLQDGVFAKDLVLYLIGRLGAHAATGHAVEYAGEAIRALDVEARLTLCNLSIEFGAKVGMVAPDDTTYAYLEGRAYAPRGELFARAVDYWRTLPSDELARFDREVSFDAGTVPPMMTWGTSPEQVIAIDGRIPDPDAAPDAAHRDAWRNALDYMGLKPGDALEGTPVDWVFIGSCTNSRLSDLREAARLARGRHVAPGVRAWVVPGSEQVRRDAQAEGLDRIFLEAGFEWREPGCSMCVAANGETVPSGARAVSTSNRNFVGRQGPGARTHLASPQSAVAAAVTGVIADSRRLAHE
ncbi:3-isopropylmalate dehydratase large subunit [Paraburkholderia megapolitana]|uniref:3-isopropylmalate dehydratase n=1 Tax=Paraburkholderia megapolitana TaxID=420953 RepID=A0A1I3L897_9BURK|nr:3-isopropylmalate dehydratase large subunit [Paraburkholderia megapolitana]QDQ80605.1 3-isopropylmalate dehydratase large subunit [Paraburkholderia megapolitana]SFI80983.1 3-isopropylmalate dehydratase, large subunit [Paraburkholderia megapolitana]